jgi:hypothetical protein
MLKRVTAALRESIAWVRFGRNHPARKALSVEELFRLEEVVASIDLSNLKTNVWSLMYTMQAVSTIAGTAAPPVSEFRKQTGFCLTKEPSGIPGKWLMKSRVVVKFVVAD